MTFSTQANSNPTAKRAKPAIFVALLSALIVLTCSACSSSDTKAPAADPASPPVADAEVPAASPVKEAEAEQEEKTKDKVVKNSVDGVNFELLGITTSTLIGDRTAENVGQKDGEYTALGSDIIKVSDYEAVDITMHVENTSDKAITFAPYGWSAVMPDGYKLKNISVVGDISAQIPAGYMGDSTLKVIAQKSMNVKEFILSYDFLDYNDEYNQSLSEVLLKGMTEEEYKTKYGEKFVPTKISFDVNR